MPCAAGGESASTNLPSLVSCAICAAAEDAEAEAAVTAGDDDDAIHWETHLRNLTIPQHRSRQPREESEAHNTESRLHTRRPIVCSPQRLPDNQELKRDA